MLRAKAFSEPITTTLLLRFHRHLTTSAAAITPTSSVPNPPSPVNEAQLLKVCTILYQQQHSPDSKLHTSLLKASFHLDHEFFLRVCNSFSLSWRPVYKLHHFARTQPHFRHTSATFNKMLDVVGKSRNNDLFWDLLQEIGRLGLVTTKTFIIALKVLGSARELHKCVQTFHVMNGFGYSYSVEVLNKVVEAMCRSKLVVEANHVVVKLKHVITPDGITFRWLIYGFCDVGSLLEASKLWNLMNERGIGPDIETVETMLETLFKNNMFSDSMKLFQSMRVKRIDDLGVSTYRLMINWLCKKGKLAESYVLFEEMLQRGIKADNDTLAWMVYGFVSRGRVREGYKIVEGIEKPDISVYHGLIKGLLKLKRAREATKVFREMIKRGCEPTMHTYIILLQGHLGKRGRKGADPLVNFDTIFVGGLVKAGKSLEATKYVERVMNRGVEVPRFDYNRFLHYFSNEEGVEMFEVMTKKLREVGLFDLADIFSRYGEKMATRDRRRNRGEDAP